ncbi:MAG: hypothetical protein K2I30_05610 [Clostridia bacterium]|nr:hypothetical protein [Clostridia bacterium]
MKLEPYEIKIMRGGKTVCEFKTDMLALIGLANGTTLCTASDLELRVFLASRVELYLDSLKRTITKDTHGLIDKETINKLIKCINESTDIEEKTVNVPETVSEIIARLKREKK